MQGWRAPYLSLCDLPRELAEFEPQAFLSFSWAKLASIALQRGDNHKLGLALHIGFVRMGGWPLNSVRAVPTVLLRHLGQMLDIETPDLASLRALYARGRTLFDHQQQACEALGGFCRGNAMRPSAAAKPTYIRKPASKTGSLVTRLGL